MNAAGGISLPCDIWAIILGSLDVSDLRHFQAVCRTFYQIIRTLRQLEFRLELDVAGYAESQNPRDDITLEEKLTILREHVSRRESLTPSRIDKIWTEPNANSTPSLVDDENRVLFVQGVLAYRTTQVVDGRKVLRIDVARLPSSNRGTAMQQWTLYERDIEIYDIWIEPDLDMLVLLEIQDEIVDYDYNRNISIIYYYCVFHLRTLSENAEHPDALRPQLSLGGAFRSRKFCVQFIGSFICVLTADSMLSVWDWTVGDRLVHGWIKSGWQSGLAVLCNSLITVANPDQPTRDVNDWPRTTLDIFSMNNSDDSDDPLRRLASLQLPIVERGPLFDEFSRRKYYPYFRRLIFRRDPGYRPVTNMCLSRAPASIFEISNVRQVLQLDIVVSMHSDEGDPIKSSCSSLYIPVKTILRAVSRVQTDASEDRVIPWNEWGAETRWVHRCDVGPEVNGHRFGSTAGSRCALTHFGPRCSDCQQGESGDGPSSDLTFLEFHPALQHTNGQPESQQSQVPNDHLTWMYQPPELDSLTPGRYWFDKWLKSCSAEIPRHPCKMARFKHEVLGELSATGQHPRILIDDEHVVAVQQTEDGDLRGITVITF